MDASQETLIAVFGEERVKNDIIGICEFMTKHPDEYHQKVWDYYAKRKNENLQICRECGGNCCKSVSCHYAPDDFKSLTYRALKRLMIKKRYISGVKFSKMFIKLNFDESTQISYLKHFYILRIRTSGTGIAVRAADVYEDDLCMLLGKNGCLIPYEERPKGARMLIPKRGRRCEQLYNMDDCVHDWVKYQALLEKLYRYFERREKIAKILKFVHL